MAWMIDGLTANDPVSDVKVLLMSGEIIGLTEFMATNTKNI